MKTLVMLSAFAAVAFAAPTLLEQGPENLKKTFTNVPDANKREKKSPQEATNSDNSAPTASLNQPLTSQISEFGVSGRSFGLKKPIIIKKKPVGYQVYRDSDEVASDSEETCGSQVKVKFCDGKAKMKSAAIDIDNTQMTEEDMKHSITLAKEALETIQRDLNIVEKKPGTQTGSWTQGHSESDTELHQDIEVAREALENIHKNFGNLESMSLHATTLNNEDNDPNAALSTAKTEQQRLAQWKEAIKTIQKNVEIARNIEDSFREASGEAGLFSDATSMNNKQELNKKMDHKLRTSEDSMTDNTDKKANHDNCKSEHAHEKSSEKENTKVKPVEDDMTSSASTMSEKKLKDFNDSEKTKYTSESLSGTEKKHSLNMKKPLEETSKEKNADDDTKASKDLSEKSGLISDSMKVTKDNKDENDKKMASTEIAVTTDASTDKMKSVETEDMLINDMKKDVTSTETLKKLETKKEKHPELKLAEDFDQSDKKKQEEDMAQFTKSAEETPNIQKKLLAESKVHENTPVNEMTENHFAEAKMASKEDTKQNHKLVAPVNHAEQMQFSQHQQPFFHPEMRATEDLKSMHQQQMLNSEIRWAHEKNTPLQREAMISGDGVHSQSIDHVHTVHHPGHRHNIAHSMKNQHFEIPSDHEQLQSRYSNNFIAQGKSADPEMAYYMSMRDGSSMGPDSHRFRWKPSHEGRTAYGPSAASVAANPSSGAVGLFPNANVGGCGIPLLLSCNPSVVSGSLAKPSPSYSAPAYRTEDDFNFHTKRDVKKTHENLSSLHRTPKANLKTSTVLVAKQ